MNRTCVCVMLASLYAVIGCTASQSLEPTARGLSGPTITVTQPLHVRSASNEPLTVPSGAYQVEAASESSLKLVTTSGGPALMLAATTVSHEQQLQAPTAVEITDET